MPGWINASRESSSAAIEAAEIEERTVDVTFEIIFPYVCMNDVMKVIKDEKPRIISQDFDNLCSITMAIRNSRADVLEDKLRKVEGAGVEKKG